MAILVRKKEVALWTRSECSTKPKPVDWRYRVAYIFKVIVIIKYIIKVIEYDVKKKKFQTYNSIITCLGIRFLQASVFDNFIPSTADDAMRLT